MINSFTTVIMAAGSQDYGYLKDFGVDKLNFTLGNGNSLIQEICNRYQGSMLTKIVLNNENSKVIKSDLITNCKYEIVLSKECKGALASLLLSLENIDMDQPVLVVPSDGLVPKVEFTNFVREMSLNNVDCGIMVFPSSNLEYSYVRTDAKGEVLEIAEKQIISNLATAGIFYFKNVELIIECGQWAIVNNLSFKDIFYIAPSLNYFVTSGLKIRTYNISEDSYLRFANSRHAKLNWQQVR